MDGGSFQKVSVPKVGDIVAYPNDARHCNHWAIVTKVTADEVVLLEQNWKWTSNGTTYAINGHKVGIHSPVGNSGGYGNPRYYHYVADYGLQGSPEISDQKVLNQQLSLNKSSVTLGTCLTYQLKASIQNRKPGATVAYKSSNKGIASVSSSGKIKGVRTGTTYVTAWIKGTSIAKKCKVRVIYGPRILRLRASKLTFVKVKKFSLKGKIYNRRSGDRIKYKSSNKRVVCVSSKGVVTRKRRGKAVITAWIPGTKVKKTCKVTVR
jgi:hypothetical protein